MTQVNVFYTVLSLVGVKKVPMVTRGSSKPRTLSHVGGTPVNLKSLPRLCKLFAKLPKL